MRAFDIIQKKRKCGTLDKEEITFVCHGFTNGNIPDYQMSALLMAICINGMTSEETFNLTDAMLHSGDTMDMSAIQGIVVDKHSTGGVGDTTTLALAPILACCNVKCAKMSGRGLGFTGGTIDKLESIPHFNTALTEEQFFDVVNTVGCAVIGQTQNLVPADKKMYALRDVTATIDSLPLICSSIMSKKLASGAQCILLDVKYGEGAFMKTPEQALELSKMMVDIGTRAGRKISALITDMRQPLSQKIGNSIEVMSAIEVLNGADNRLYHEICEVGSRLLATTGLYTEQTAMEKIKEVISNGSALAKLKEMVKAQGGDVSYIDNPQKFRLGTPYSVTADKDGYIYSMKTDDIGNALTLLGGGRIVKSDTIDNSVGICLHVVLGDKVTKGQTIATIYHNEKGLREARSLIASAINIKATKPKKEKIAYAYVTSNNVEIF